MDILGYVRVSSEDQATGGHSLALVQPERLRAWAAANGHTLVDVIIDGEGEGDTFRGVSGGKPLAKRTGGAELLRRLDAGEAQGVVVASLTRIFRDVDDGRFFMRKAWRKAGIQLFSLSEPVDVTSAGGRFQLTIMLATGEYERELTAERTAQVAQSLRRSGRVYGTVPYGCIAAGGNANADGKTVNQLLYRDPMTWPMRKAIVAMRNEGKSLRDISAHLRRNHIPAPNGGTHWAPSTINALVLSHESLAHLPLQSTQVAAPAPAAPEAQVSADVIHIRPIPQQSSGGSNA